MRKYFAFKSGYCADRFGGIDPGFEGSLREVR